MSAAIRANPLYEKYPLPQSAMPKWLVWLIAPYIGMYRQQIANGVGHVSTVDNTKSKTELGMEYMSMEETLQNMFAQMIAAGVIQEPTTSSA